MGRRGLALVAVAWVLAGCESTVKRTLPDSVRTLYVKPFQNLTDQSQLPPLLNDELRRAFRLDGRVTIVDQQAGAHGLLDGSITDYVKQPARYDRNNIVEEYRLRIVVDLSLTDLDRNVLLWQEKGPASTAAKGASLRKLERYVNYTVVPATGLPVETESDAQRRTIRDLAQDIVIKVIEGW